MFNERWRAARRRLCARGAGALLLVFVLMATGAAADVATADLAVTVVAGSAAGASVEVTAESNQSRRWNVTVAAGARRTLHGLEPGRYLVRATVGATAAETTVSVIAGDLVTVEVSTPGANGVEPRVSVVYLSRPGQGSSFIAEDLSDLSAGNSLNALLDTAAPFVMADRQDNGGLATGDWARMGSRGSSWTAARLHLGDEEIDAPNARGLMPFYADLVGMEAVGVLSGLADPSIATPGSSVTLTPRRPGTRRRLVVAGAFTSSGMVDSGPSDGPPLIGSVNKWHDASFRWDGPITSRLGAVVTGSVDHVDADRRGVSGFASTVSSFMTHLVAAPSDRDEVRILASAQQIRRPFDVAAANGADERDQLASARVTWDRHDVGGSWKQLSVGFRRAAFTPDRAAADGGTFDRALEGPVPAPASADVLRSLHVRLTFAPADRRVGGLNHSLRAVLEARRTDATTDVLGAPTVGELAAGLAARVWSAELPSTGSRRHVTSTVLALNDDIAFSRRLTLTLGVRGDISSAGASGAAQSISWRSASSLAALRWAPNWLTMTAGFRRYARQLSTDLAAFGDPGEPLVNVYRWTDVNANARVDGGEQGTLVARAGRAPSVAGIADDLHASHTDEFALRAERRLGASQYIRVSATVRRESDIVRSVNTGAPLSAYRALTVANEIQDPKRARDGLLTVYDRLPASFGQDFYVLDNAPGEGARYRGLEISWEMRSRRWFSMLGASAYESSGLGGNRGFRVDEADAGVIGELLENPNAESVADSRLFFDRAYVLKWSTIYRGPRGFSAGITARYQDGQPFARLVLVPELAQGPEVVASDYSVATRFSFTGTIDAHLAQTFAVSGRRVTATLDVFNLSNLADEVEEYSVSGPTFRVSTAMQPTRTVRAGFRFEF